MGLPRKSYAWLNVKNIRVDLRTSVVFRRLENLTTMNTFLPIFFFILSHIPGKVNVETTVSSLFSRDH